MARIRTIKPEFFTSEDIVALSAFARLLYVALWCEADKEGRLIWKPKTFKMRYLPADDLDILALCKELTDSRLVVLYGDGLAHIPQFRKHQHINPRESESGLPDPVSTREPRVKHASARVTVAPVTHREEGKGREGDIDASDDATELSEFSIPLNDGSEWAVTTRALAEWVQSFPAVDVEQELREMRAWANANPAKRKTSRGIAAFAVRWLSKAQDTPGRGGKPANDDPYGLRNAL
jgi:hypothetical protein